MAKDRVSVLETRRVKSVLRMRPAILNPLFAETATLKGVGAALVRQLARLKLARVIDLVFHLPVMAIDRVVVERLDESLVGRPVIVTLTIVRHDAGGPRSPLRVRAVDAGGQWVDLVFFGQTGQWARTKLPLQQQRRIIGQARPLWAERCRFRTRTSRCPARRSRRCASRSIR